MRMPLPDAAAPDETPAHDLAAQLGGEVAWLLSMALERVNLLAATGRIDRHGLRALRNEIEGARRIGMMGQQVSRFASGGVRLAREPLDLALLLREALQQRGAEIASHGLEVREVLRPARATGDATLTFSLLLALLDWSLEHARSRIDLALEPPSWREQARIACRFAHRPPDEVPSEALAAAPPRLDTVSWRLLEQMAGTLALTIERADEGGRTRLTIAFPRRAAAAPDPAAPVAGDAGTDSSFDALPLAGSHVLVIAARRELRNLVREALRPQGPLLDFVPSLDEARAFCRDGLPHAVVHEAELGGEAFEQLRRELLAAAPTLAFVQISDDSPAFEVRHAGGRQFASVGRAAVVDSLPSALMFEIARCG